VSELVEDLGREAGSRALSRIRVSETNEELYLVTCDRVPSLAPQEHSCFDKSKQVPEF